MRSRSSPLSVAGGGWYATDPGLFHLAEELRALARALADAAEHRVAAVLGRDVPDELLDDDRLPHPGAAEHGSLSTLEERADEVDDLHPGLEDLGLSRLLCER